MADAYPQAIFYDSKTTVFDWDAQWREATAEILARYDADPDRDAFLDRWRQGMAGYFLSAAFIEYRDLDPCITDALRDAYHHFGLDGDAEADVEVYREKYDEVRPFPEASEALRRQQAHTDVISNVESRYLDMMVEELDGVEPDLVATMEDAGSIKPSPYAYR